MSFLKDNLGSIAGAGLGFAVGGPYGAVIGASMGGSSDQNKANTQASAKQMAFQERMSSTAHQREVTDLRAAGLNPILSGTGGKGSSAPAGAQPRIENVGKEGAQAGLNALLQDAQIRNLNANSAKAAAEASKITRQSTVGGFFKEQTNSILEDSIDATSAKRERSKQINAEFVKNNPFKITKVKPPGDTSSTPLAELPDPNAKPEKHVINNQELYTLKSRDGKKTYFSVNGIEYHTKAEITKILNKRKQN